MGCPQQEPCVSILREIIHVDYRSSAEPLLNVGGLLWQTLMFQLSSQACVVEHGRRWWKRWLRLSNWTAQTDTRKKSRVAIMATVVLKVLIKNSRRVTIMPAECKRSLQLSPSADHFQKSALDSSELLKAYFQFVFTMPVNKAISANSE